MPPDERQESHAAGPEPGRYWDDIAAEYQRVTRISCDDFHYGPLLPGDRELKLLPPQLRGRRCLELGCGGAQNSIYLARRGAQCLALDISEEQLRHARLLAEQHEAEIEFVHAGMDDLAEADLGTFDLVHSTYALPFAADPEGVVAAAAGMLRENGLLLLTTAHPVYAGEWLEIDGEGEGLFLNNYFRPPADVRFVAGGEPYACSRAHPISTVIDWLQQAGLRLLRLLEPEPLPVPIMTEADIQQRIPYDSPDWRELYPQIANIPPVVVLLAARES